MSKILFIVESPGKIKKIQSILGSQYIVDASVGHVMDIPSDDMHIDVKNNFEPYYKVKPGYTKKVSTLKNLAKQAKFIILAMDEDREGEAIANGLIMALCLKKGTYHRVGFNEITKKGIMKGIDNPRPLNYDLVYAQKARCVLDKYIGYSLSPLLWKAIMPKLSAGRVQSIVGRVIVDKENEIKQFFENGAGTFFKTKGYFIIEKQILECNLYEKDSKNDNVYQGYNGSVSKMEDEKVMYKFLDKCKKSEYKIAHMFDKASFRNPSPPFITSSLQQEASIKFGFGPKITMSIAQSLYEKGLITYMRTDSTMIADDAIKEIKKYVIDRWGKEYFRKLQYKSKIKNAQEAHEAIRPTHIENINGGITPQEKKLYSLIWKRTVASQMAPAKINNKYIQIDISKNKDYYFESKFEEILFLGFLKVYNEEIKNDIINFKLEIGQKINVDKIQSKQDYDRPPNRFTEASMIKHLEKNGIGRPSTYASMVDKVIQKKYAEKGDISGVEKDSKILTLNFKNNIKLKEELKKIIIGKETNKLTPTSLGFQVIDYLVNKFDQVMDYKFTAKMEDKFDDISNGKQIWYNVLNEFNDNFKKILDNEQNTSNKNNIYNDPNKRVLGTDNVTGYQVIATKGPYGSYIKLEGPTKGKSKIASIEDNILSEINLDEALELLKYPFELGKYENKKIFIKKGLSGIYLNWNKQNFPIPENITEIELTSEKASNIINNKNKNNYGQLIGTKKEIYTILNGDYGPFVNIQKGKKKFNVSLKSLVKDDLSKLKDVTVEQIENIIKNNKSKYKKN